MIHFTPKKWRSTGESTSPNKWKRDGMLCVYFALSHFSHIVSYFTLPHDFSSSLWFIALLCKVAFGENLVNDDQRPSHPPPQHPFSLYPHLSLCIPCIIHFPIIYAWTIETRTAEIQLKWHSTFHKVTLRYIFTYLFAFLRQLSSFQKTQTTFSSSLYSFSKTPLYVYLVCLQMNTFLALSQHATQNSPFYRDCTLLLCI